MELIDFEIYGDLDHNISTYDFSDCYVKVNDELTIIIDGQITLEFDKIDESFNHEFGCEVVDCYCISKCYINIMNITTDDFDNINLSKDLMNSLKQEIENELNTYIID